MVIFQKKLSIVVFVLSYFLLFSSAYAEKYKFEIDRKAVGVIKRLSDGKNIGSAFVAGKQKHLITCAHVATGNGFAYRGASIPKNIGIKSEYYLPKFDLSVFSLNDPIDIKPLKFGDSKSIRPGDTIIYIGWDKKLSKMKVNRVKVFSIGSCYQKGVIIDFIEFYGHGLPGYSGGPVFNIKGEVVAIMREAWTKKGIKGGTSLLVNRAFSTEILSVFDQEIFKKEQPDLSLNTNEIFGLINVKKK